VPKIQVRGPKGMDRTVSWPDKKTKTETTSQKEIYEAVKRILEDNKNLTFKKESDIVSIADEVSRLFK
jgi:hypothetical protein